MITYLVGDATYPQGPGPHVIAHVCNDLGKWGAGFSGAISKRWKIPEWRYRAWAEETDDFKLGRIMIVPVDGFYIVNMVAQRGFPTKVRPVALSYEALDQCLGYLRWRFLPGEEPINMPRIGCGLAGGDWAIVEELINTNLAKHDVRVYDLPVHSDYDLP